MQIARAYYRRNREKHWPFQGFRTSLNSMQIQPEITEKVNRAPQSPGCYLWKSASGEVLYAGKADRLRTRLKNYLRPDTIKTSFLMGRAADVDWISTETTTEALLLEDTLIKKYKPKYNVRLKDDKRYPYMCLSVSEMYPRLYITRQHKQDGNLYFGPYTDVRAARQILKFIYKTFPIRKVRQKLPLKKPRRPCMNYHIKRCLAPCSNNVRVEEYNAIVEEIRLFLEGKHELLEEKISRRMNEYSENLEFEKAGIYRDMLTAVRKMSQSQTVARPGTGDEDVIGISVRDEHAQAVVMEYRSGRLTGQKSCALEGIRSADESEILSAFLHEYYIHNDIIPSVILIPGEADGRSNLQKYLSEKTERSIQIRPVRKGPAKGLIRLAEKNAALALAERMLAVKMKDRKEGLVEIQSMLGLNTLPDRIECYDISHLQGKSTVAAGVQFIGGHPNPSGYRHYIIKSVQGIDDPASMAEVIARRLQRIREESLEVPDLIVIDGGYTQLQAACEVAVSLEFEELPVIGLAKQREEIYLPGKSEPLTPDPSSAGMRILRHLRDEAHRFGITHQRKRSNKSQLDHLLEKMPGVGKSRVRLLLKHLTDTKIEEATPKQLQSVPGIGKELSERIYKALHSADMEMNEQKTTK